jgi:hypothetical protein
VGGLQLGSGEPHLPFTAHQLAAPHAQLTEERCGPHHVYCKSSINSEMIVNPRHQLLPGFKPWTCPGQGARRSLPEFQVGGATALLTSQGAGSLTEEAWPKRVAPLRRGSPIGQYWREGTIHWKLFRGVELPDWAVPGGGASVGDVMEPGTRETEACPCLLLRGRGLILVDLTLGGS